MGLKTCTIDFTEFSQEYLLRASYRTVTLSRSIQKHIRNSQNTFVRLKECCNIDSGFAFKSEDYVEEGIPLLRIGDIDNNFSKNNMVFLPENYREEYKEFIVKKNDIVLSLTGDGTLKSNLIVDDEKYLLNQRVGRLRVKENIHKLFLYYTIHYYSLTKQQFYCLSSGKSQLNISPSDVLNIKIPFFPKREQYRIADQIEPIEKKIQELAKQMIPLPETINSVFAREFGFHEKLFNEFGKGMTAGTQIAQDRTLRVFESNIQELLRSSTLRSSTRYHNPSTRKIMNILNNMPTIQVKDIVESYEKGVQPEYNANGKIPVVKIANLRNSYIDFSESEYVIEDYYNSLDVAKKLMINDIVFCATGKISLGKIDLYNYERESLTTVDNYIIRLNERYDSLFFTYFFRCILGYFQIERDYMGTTNQIHLYWEDIENFQIPNIPLESQQRIASEIRKESDKQEKIKVKIESERNMIHNIIENWRNF